MMLPTVGCAVADNIGEVQAAEFVKVKVSFPDTIESRNSWLTRARYKDTGEVIPLSLFYNGDVYATIPVENKNNHIEGLTKEQISNIYVNDLYDNC